MAGDSNRVPRIAGANNPGLADSSPRPDRARHERSLGQGLVEFALVLPVFLLLLLFAVDFGRLFFTYIQLDNAARETAAYAAVNPTTGDADLTTFALQEANVQGQRGESPISATSACVDSSGGSIACSTAAGGDGPGNRITVNTSETFTFLTPLIGNFWPGGLHIASSASAAVFVYAASAPGDPSGACTTLPTASFTWQGPDPNQPNRISVDATASSPASGPCAIIGYNWDFGGPSTDSGADYLAAGMTYLYSYASGGTYVVTLTVQNAAGPSAPTTRTVTVGAHVCQQPTASFTVSPAAIYDNQDRISNWQAANGGGNQATPFTFDGSASAFMADSACHPEWSWDLGDGTTPAPATPSVSHAYANAYAGTTVTVRLTVTNDAGNSSATVQIPLQ